MENQFREKSLLWAEAYKANAGANSLRYNGHGLEQYC